VSQFPTEPEARDRASRILIVDDNEDAAAMLAELLAATGYRTCHANDGPAALALAEQFDPHIVILDIGLPVMDGYEVARCFTAHPRMRRASLVALTGYGQAQDRDRSREAGFIAHLVKPVDLDQLRRVLASVPPLED
jgi:CheY-like chemotaxis protein